MPTERVELTISSLDQVEMSPAQDLKEVGAEAESLGGVNESAARKTSLYPEGNIRHP